MKIQWPTNPGHKDHVFYPMNSSGTTWLRDSELVFVKSTPYAVLSWKRDGQGEVPEVYIELKPKLLEHERPGSPVWRYTGEVPDPTSPRRPASAGRP